MTYIKCEKRDCDNNWNGSCQEHEITMIFHPDGLIPFYCNCDTTLKTGEGDILAPKLEKEFIDEIRNINGDVDNILNKISSKITSLLQSPIIDCIVFSFEVREMRSND